MPEGGRGGLVDLNTTEGSLSLDRKVARLVAEGVVWMVAWGRSLVLACEDVGRVFASAGWTKMRLVAWADRRTHVTTTLPPHHHHTATTSQPHDCKTTTPLLLHRHYLTTLASTERRAHATITLPPHHHHTTITLLHNNRPATTTPPLLTLSPRRWTRPRAYYTTITSPPHYCIATTPTTPTHPLLTAMNQSPAW